MTGITTIIPTIDRSTAARCYNSVGAQMKPRDKVILAHDISRQGCFGHPVRNQHLDQITPGRYCWSVDDDDIAVTGAFDAMRNAIDSFPGSWFLFQMRGGANSHYAGVTVPVSGMEGVLRKGNVGTPMILWPNCDARFGTGPGTGLDHLGKDMGDGYFGDWFMAEALQLELGDPVWIDTCVAEIRP